MENNLNFKNYLIISQTYFRICVFQKSKNMIAYDKKLLFDHHNNQIDYSKLDNFLENHVFKIEKEFNFFLKDIYIIIENDIFFKLQISLKKNYYAEKISNNDLNYLLKEAKSLTKKSLEGNRISHIFIENYQIDQKDYTFFPENLICSHFSIDVCFICLSDQLMKEIERVLKKYQIFSTKTISSNYINNLYPEDNQSIIKLITRLQNVINENEVSLTLKNTRKSGLFEKFFHLFS